VLLGTDESAKASSQHIQATMMRAEYHRGNSFHITIYTSTEFCNLSGFDLQIFMNRNAQGTTSDMTDMTILSNYDRDCDMVTTLLCITMQSVDVGRVHTIVAVGPGITVFSPNLLARIAYLLWR
jgi:hypothetical protein